MPKKRRNGLFDFLKPRTTVYHVKRRKSKSTSHLSASIRKLGPSHKIVKVGDHYEVPSLDRGSWFDTRDDAQRFIREMKKYPNPKRKRNIELGLPSNKFVNAKVRMKGNKVQVMVDERLLGRVGASGGVSVNPKRKRNASALREIGTWKIEQRWKFAPSVAPKKLAKLIRADGGEVKVVRGGVNYRARSK